MKFLFTVLVNEKSYYRKDLEKIVLTSHEKRMDHLKVLQYIPWTVTLQLL